MANHKITDSQWDQKISSLGGGITQSSAWADFQLSLGREPYSEYGENWAYLAILRKAKAVKYLMVSYGPLATNLKSLEGALDSLTKLAKKVHVDFIRFEPICKVKESDLIKLGAKKTHEVDPMHSQILDLTLDEARLRSDLHSGHRNLINGTKRRGIDIFLSDKEKDQNEFIKMLNDTAKRSKIKFYSPNFYQKLFQTLLPKKSANLYIAKVGEKPVAAAVFYDFEGIRYYAHAGAYQKLNREIKASVSLVWQAIMDAKNLGMSKFDLWGIAASDDPNHPWAGITKFKKAFGGKQINYLGTWDLPINKLKYKAYKLYSLARNI